VIVLERAFAPGAGGIVAADIGQALAGLDIRVSTVVAGLGGRAVTISSVKKMLGEAKENRLPQLSFLDLRTDLIERELSRRDTTPHHKHPLHPQHLLRDAGAPGSRIG
jgi:pyruvate ferredoxin oxidoreductase alpha subunit